MTFSRIFKGLVCAMALASSTTVLAKPLQIVGPWEVASSELSKTGFAFQRLQVIETLVEVDKEGALIAGLAQNWSVSDDGLIWRFHLKPDVRFHDGSQLTADAAANALNIARKKAGMLKNVPITAIYGDANAVVIELSKAYAFLPATLTHYSTAILAPSAYIEDQVSSVIGTGAYKVSLFQPPQKIETQRFADYHGNQGQLEEVNYLAVSRGETRALMAQSGDAEVVFNLDPATISRFSKTDKIAVYKEALPRVIVLKPNVGLPLLSDVRVRQALNFAIDRQAIVSAVLRTPDMSAAQLFLPSMKEWYLPAVDANPFNLDKAQDLLAQAGWTKGKDGILVKDNQRFSFTLRTFPDRPELPLIATALQEQFKKIGVDMQISIGSYTEIPAGHQDGTLEMALLARNFGLVADPLATIAEDYGAKGGEWGAMNWENPRLIEITQTLLSDAKANRYELAQEAAGILHQELPSIAVVHYLQTAAVSPKLKGFSIDPFERSYRVVDLKY